MEPSNLQKLNITCGKCGHKNSFNQPHEYHAGFSNQGFLYNEAGNLTFVWSSFDPAYIAIVGKRHPWSLDEGDREKVEHALSPSPSGDAWKFGNPPRCLSCKNPIGQSILNTICYLQYDGSINADNLGRDQKPSFKDFIERKAT